MKFGARKDFDDSLVQQEAERTVIHAHAAGIAYVQELDCTAVVHADIGGVTSMHSASNVRFLISHVL